MAINKYKGPVYRAIHSNDQQFAKQRRLITRFYLLLLYFQPAFPMLQNKWVCIPYVQRQLTVFINNKTE